VPGVWEPAFSLARLELIVKPSSVDKMAVRDVY